MLDVSITLLPQYDLVPLAQHDVLPQYFIYCGLVFQVLSLDYLTNVFMHAASAPKELLVLFESGSPSQERIEVVVLSQVLTHSVNTGYDESINSVISQGSFLSLFLPFDPFYCLLFLSLRVSAD